jgi:vancomycin resistance protein YoaR
MTTTTETQLAGATVDAGEGRRWRARRVLLAFVIGVLLVVLATVGTILAYEQNYAGKVAAGVSIGGVDVAGLTRDEAAAKLEASLASFGTGTLTLQTPTGATTLTYAQLGRRPDVDGMLDEAFAIGRTGDPLQRVVEEARTVLHRVDVGPRVAIDQAVLEASLATLATKIETQPTAAVVTSGPTGFVDTPAVWGRDVNEAAMVASISQALASPDAPAALTIPLSVVPVAPTVTDVDAMIARSRANRMIAPVVLTHGKDHWTIADKTVRTWISFGSWPDGSYGPLVDTAKIEAAIKALSVKVDQAAVSASFYTSKGGGIVGVKPARVGRKLDVPGTVSAVQALLIARAGAGKDPSAGIVPALAIVQPQLTTEQASKAAPLMKAISSWTTYYQSGPHNGFSANITIPSMAINGTVVAPGEWFSYWKTVGEVSLAKGYKLGGAIIDGHSVEGTSIGGGICSSSTTLFNAAIRAGLQMGARKNHYYYIARYPKGLDATVFKDGGSVQDMTFRNDTKYPILIRTYARPGIVRFTLYSVPTGRRVSFSKPLVKNYRPGYTTTRYVTSLRPGAQEWVEYPADGQDVWVTRVVKDRSGKVIHKETYYSHYARMIGILLIGRKK